MSKKLYYVFVRIEIYVESYKLRNDEGVVISKYFYLEDDFDV